VTAATTAVAVSQAAIFGAICVIMLIGLLIAKERLSASGSEKAKRFGRKGCFCGYSMVEKW
jgi:hypothetical protein